MISLKTKILTEGKLWFENLKKKNAESDLQSDKVDPQIAICVSLIWTLGNFNMYKMKTNPKTTILEILVCKVKPDIVKV